MPTTPTPITALPAAPDRADRATFSARATAFFSALKDTFVGQINALADATNANAVEVAANAVAVATNAATATAAAAAAASAASAPVWVSGQTYAQYAAVLSPLNLVVYRRTSAAGSGTTDPSLDTTNYQAVGSVPTPPSPSGANLYLAANFGAL